MGENRRPAHEARADERMVVLGRISGVFGVRGWVKIYSHTEPRDNILQYSPWHLGGKDGWKPRRLIKGQVHGKGVLAHISGCDDRDAAQMLVGLDIAIPRNLLPGLDQDDYYWSDLEGLRVETLDGVELGAVHCLFDTGANDVMVVRGDRERLIPYLWGQVVKRVDLEAGLIQVDWDADF